MLALVLACASSSPTVTPVAPIPPEDVATAAAAAAPAAPAAPAVREESIEQLAAALAAGGNTLVDVRSPAEFAAGHVPGAVNIPLDQLESRVSQLPASGDVHFICAAGVRSGKATAMLTAMGRPAVNVSGGTNAWIAAGHAVEK